MDFAYVSRFLPFFFSYDVAFNMALNTAGGTIIAWTRSFSLVNTWSTKHAVTVILKHLATGSVIVVTNAYGPTDDTLKQQFIHELRYMASLVSNPWLLVGDFNLIRWMVDRSTGSRNFDLMDRFNEFISEVGIIDIPLHNRTFTWTNKRPQPTLSKLDRIFISTEWSSSYLVITLEALEIIVSDHAPLVLTCKGLLQRKKRFRLETYWFKYQTPKAMVQRLWGQSLMGQPIVKFHQRTHLLHRALHLWRLEAFGHLEKQLEFCGKAILFFDQIEEKRPLALHEFQLRIQIRERAFELASNIEAKWKQRSTCNWLANGDRNSKFFHALASSRLRRNLVLQIQQGGQTITQPTEIRDAFTGAMRDILGTSSQVLSFDATALYDTNPTLDHLGVQFNLEEIELAVKQLANNKASGPDGLPNEFVKIYWEDLKHEILRIMNDFYDLTLDLKPFNEARIVMIPKVESSTDTSDFRPISVLNLIPKLISKILANRLRTSLPDLISCNQTAFVHGRQISENFVSTREVLHHVSQSNTQAIFAKIDFRKAFDTVEWLFLDTIMRARGFPPRWITWMWSLWSTSSYRVCVNGEDSDPFIHKRGLRQGDPLSPMLFILAVDVFQVMVQKGNALLDGSLSAKLTVPIVAFQYADDTAVVACSDISTLITFKLILRLFTSISGLQVNYSKSTYIPINISQEDLPWIHMVIGFSKTNFPVTYLGMPLTIKRPGKALYLPLVEKIERRLDGWQSKLLSRGGRFELVQTVMSTIPIYYMTCFLLPKWVVDRIDKARRSFLWGRSGRQGRSISLCNWELVSLPKPCGGMGIAELHTRNISLLLRWWWKGHNERNGMWSATITTIRWQGLFTPGPMLWSKRGSFFWSQLLSIKHLFDWSITWSVGDGNSISYWYDKWGTEVLKQTGSRCMGHAISLRSAVQSGSMDLEEEISFTDGQQDIMSWCWEGNQVYSAKSIYKLLTEGGLIKWEFSFIWKLPIPPSVRIFIYLLLNEKLLTRDVMVARHFPIQDTSCPLCDSCSLETANHIFFECSYSRRLWNKLTSLVSRTIMVPGQTTQEVWASSEHGFANAPGMRSKWRVLFSSACWSIWKQRNCKVFRTKMYPMDMTVQWIVRQATLWKTHYGGSK